ncbi:MAG: hypothetical protein AB7U92_01190 [Piscinibacter sp.]|uniref:hypothetical protein n=1 Tax=Piscinibacter sp. TaxID=1903157 RepID=UPI003D1426E1
MSRAAADADRFERRVRADLQRRRWLRVHSFLLGLLCFLACWAISAGLLRAGMTSLALRWSLALAGGYLVFLGLLWLWCRWLLSRGEVDGDWPLEGADALLPSRRGGGGVECGDSGLEAGDLAEGALEVAGAADEGALVAVPLLVVLGIAALIASGLSMAVFGLFGVEVLLGVAVEIAFAAAGGALAFRARREGWLLHATGRTWRPMLALIVVAALLGAVIDHWLPQAGSLPQAIRLLRG